MKKLLLSLLLLPVVALAKPVDLYNPATTVNDTDELYVYEVAAPHDFYLTPLQLKNYVLTNVPGSAIANGTITAAKLSFTLATVATSGSYSDLINTPTIPAAQVNSDWNASSGLAQILNKPTLATVATSGSYADLSNKPSIQAPISLTTTGSGAATFNGTTGALNIPTPSAGGLATVATSGSYNDLTSKPSIPSVASTTAVLKGNGAGGAVAATPGTDYLTASYTLLGDVTGTPGATVANNASHLTNFPSASVMGLGSAATNSASAFDTNGAAAAVQSASLQKSSNLSDLGSASTARTNLGLSASASSAVTNAVNAASGLVGVNSAGYSAPNVNTSHSGFLVTGLQGAFLSGLERSYLAYSGDMVNFSQVHGLENYSPPAYVNTYTGTLNATTSVTSLSGTTGVTVGASVTGTNIPANTVVASISGTTATLSQAATGSGSTSLTFSQPTGIRDPAITKIGNKYFVASTISYNGGASENYCDVASSPDLVNWTHVGNIGSFAAAPKWFYDPVGGGTWVVGYGQRAQNTSTTGGYPDGVTWGTPVAMTVSGFTRGYGDEALLYVGSQYIYYCCPTGSPQTYHITTSSTLGGTYADQGAPANWPTGVEGMRLTYDPTTALYYAVFSNGTYSTSSTPATPSSWSTTTAMSGLGANDNGGIMAFNDEDTAAYVRNAKWQYDATPSNYLNAGINTSSDLGPIAHGITVGSNLRTVTGKGLISFTSYASTMTGTGTLFTSQLIPGCKITGLVTGHTAIVSLVSSDTSALNANYQGNGAASSEPFTITYPNAVGYLSSYGSTPYSISAFDWTETPGNGFTYYSPNGPTWVANSGYTVYKVQPSATSWSLYTSGNNATPLVVDNASVANALHLTSTGALILGGTGSTLPSAGNVGYVASSSVASGSAVSLTTATATNICNTGALAAGHYTVTFTCTFAASGATYTQAQADINTTSATLPTSSGKEAYATPPATGNGTVTVIKDVTLTTSTTVYGVAQATFSAGTMSAFGSIQAHQIP